MLKSVFVVAGITSATLLSGISGAAALSFSGVERTVQGERAYAPIAFRIFCRRNPSECRVSGASATEYSPRIAAILRSINTSVNASIKPRSETRDNWSVAPTYGDCDDFALTKRSRLIKAGVPAGALRMASVITKAGESHEILIVHTTAGEFVLDNLRSAIVKRSQAGYRIVKVSGANPLKWTK
jgi:predicted transglutaminase-like cysteine proteinase